MRNLSKYLPAETLLVLEGKDADIKELLKITFMDLLLKQVVEIITVPKQSSSSRATVRNYKYVVKGKNFYKYNPKQHELVYLSPYLKSNSIRILFQHLVRMGFQNASSESKYRRSVTHSPNITNHFSRSIMQSIFGGFSKTNEGNELALKINAEIAQLERELPHVINSDKEKALQILNTIGGNIFLLKNIDFTLLQQIDSEILAEMNRTYTSNDGGSGCYGCSSWSSGCTGCSSSAGCSGSGCSGCGGCGGCS